MRQVLRGWLRQRFDLETVPPEFDQRIGEAGEPQLEAWVGRLVDAPGLEDVFA